MDLDPYSEPISRLTDAVIYVASVTYNFKPQLKQLKATLDRINPIIEEIHNLNLQLDRSRSESEMFADEVEEAKKLVYKCLKIKWNLYKRFAHSLKLKEVDAVLLRFFELDVRADLSRDIKRTLVTVNKFGKQMDQIHGSLRSLTVDVKNIEQTSSSGSMSFSTRRGDAGFERERLGWSVPRLPRGIVAFKEPLEKLKAKVLANIDNDDFDVSKIVVVSAAGGCGKTTLVKMLCHDSDILEKFGRNVFFVTVSETPNFMVIVDNLFNPNSFSQQVPFQSSEYAQNKLERFFRENVSSPILLVLDDVWSESFIKNFEFDIQSYRVVVTSRMVIKKYSIFQCNPLSDEDAKTLFRRSAKPSPTINENFVNQMVKCCKKHPLTLSVVGGSLDGKDGSVWRHMIRNLSKGHSVLDLNEEVLELLETSFKALEENLKECYLDFGLFLEDQRIPASALLNMWVHLYNHDDGGIDTLAKICELSYRNLVSITTTDFKKDLTPIEDFCKQQFVTQHDLLRQLAIILNSKLPIAQRPRLLISAQEDLLTTNVPGQDLPVSIECVQEPMLARILSISTGESFSSRWCDMKVPEVEVLVLNLMSKTYALPHFLKEMQKMNVLNVTNYGLYPTIFENLSVLGCLSNLTRIRLERVTVSCLSRSTLALQNIQKVSFIMCKVGNAFEELCSDNLNVWPKLAEIEMDYCHDLVDFPSVLCSSVYLKKVSITNCNKLSEISEEFGKLTCLETLSLRSCIKLEKLPESITNIQKLSILDISDCSSLSELPEEIGNLVGLRTIYMKGCSGIHVLPSSVKGLSNIQVTCNEEISNQWKDISNVKINVVEEDRLETLMRII
ncbi:NB-ARC domains-containing protein [Artemisia annua]|uniref:NB-ARC domains-containing protein n=1 Tax=Artemisia annua TaxID=35608 RepID=A0A2U1PKJ0_ARTAN|nr:NB-ARC domains-containing protein [Artemisia annua]